MTVDQDRTGRLSEATVDQLDAEIRASSFSMKSLAAEIGIDYLTLRRYLRGQRQMPTPILLMALDALGISGHAFFDRAAARLLPGSSPETGPADEQLTAPQVVTDEDVRQWAERMAAEAPPMRREQVFVAVAAFVEASMHKHDVDLSD